MTAIEGGGSIEQPFRKERFPIFNTAAGATPAGEAHAAGSVPGEGTWFCLVCGNQLSLREPEPLPSCPRCGASRFRRDSIFSALQEHGSPTVEFALNPTHEPPIWLDDAREKLAAPGYHLVSRERGEIVGYRLEEGWTRLGRCSTAEICLDDPSVSRRHAIIAVEAKKPPRVLDDRSLNGVLVNGRKTDLAELEPGDELTIGRYRLYLLQV